MALLYAVSGITVVRQDEVAIVQRWGRLVGETRAIQEHGPGLLFALPRPIDQVVRVKTQRVSELSIQTLAEPAGVFSSNGDSLDPIRVGYALSADQNIVHVAMMARYRVRDPVDWAFTGPKSEDILRVEVAAAMIRSLGEMGVDHILSDGRKDLIATASRRAQDGLDAAHSGLALVSLELANLGPPHALAPDFDDVQSAFIETETQKKNAQAFAQNVIPSAHAEADAAVQTARADAATAQAQARGDADAFLALEREYRTHSELVRERMYRDAVERAIGSAQQVRWVPPPVGTHYQGTRIQVDVQKAGARPVPPAEG